jgi:sugar phosphate isomerase/epimerase
MNWQIGVSSGACTDRSILEIVPAIRDSGAQAIEVGTPPRHFDPWRQDQVAQLGTTLAALDLEAVAIHAPFGGQLDLADPNPHHRHAAVGAILTAASAIKRLGGRLVIVHPSDLERGRDDPAAALVNCAHSLRQLADSCRQEHLTLVVETPLPHLIGGQPEEFAWLLAQVDASVRVCLDTGHIHLGRHWRQFLQIADGRVEHVHAHDNHGGWDDHLPPGQGRVDWTEVGTTLAAIGYDGWVMLELQCPGGDPAAYFREARIRTLELLGCG